jgi:hypothetical protein
MRRFFVFTILCTCFLSACVSPRVGVKNNVLSNENIGFVESYVEDENVKTLTTSKKNIDKRYMDGLPLTSIRRRNNHHTNSNNVIVNSTGGNTNENSIKVIKITNNRIMNSTTELGNVVYKIPSEMSVRSVSKVLVRISKSTVHIYENLNGVVISSDIAVTEKMEVRLIDPSSSDSRMFDIVSTNNSEQIIENDLSYTEWYWSVTPLRSGKGNLKIVISIIRENGVKELVYEDEISVKMDFIKQLKFFFGKYWQWLFGSVLIPFVVWFYNRKKTK